MRSTPRNNSITISGVTGINPPNGQHDPSNQWHHDPAQQYPPGYHTPPTPLPHDYPGYPTSAPPVSPYPQPGYYQQQYVPVVPMVPMVAMPPRPPTSGLATASLVLSIIGVLTVCFTVAIPSIAAVICGHMAMGETKPGIKSGHGMAISGLIIGYLTIAPALYVAFAYGFDKMFNG